MTHPVFPPLKAMSTQRNRRLLLTLPACALPMLTACGGGGDLSYDTEQALYVVGEAITPNKPKLDGGKPNAPSGATATFSVEPALPAGLVLNTSTGVISGIPTQLKRQAIHTVTATTTARRVRETAKTQLRITVTGRGAWTPASSMSVAKTNASIVPLPGGKFLVMGGGDDAGNWTNSAEIYDAASATWSAAASMLQFRRNPSTVVLRDGRVLVFGGDPSDAGNGNLESGVAETYDPGTTPGTWTATTGRMHEVRTGASVHLLPSGKVLAVGGFDSNTTELYDPDTGVWALLPTRLSAVRAQHAAVLLPDGKTLLLAGGAAATTAELYKVDGSATKVIPYGVESFVTRAVPLDDGCVLVISDRSNLSKRFNPAASSWTTSTMVNGARVRPTMTALADGRVLVAGGTRSINGDIFYSNTAEIYNPDVSCWTAARPMAMERFAAVAALLGEGSVLVASGDGINGYLNTSERYLP